jgi:hypothetical protein
VVGSKHKADEQENKKNKRKPESSAQDEAVDDDGR